MIYYISRDSSLELKYGGLNNLYIWNNKPKYPINFKNVENSEEYGYKYMSLKLFLDSGVMGSDNVNKLKSFVIKELKSEFKTKENDWLDLENLSVYGYERFLLKVEWGFDELYLSNISYLE